MWLTVDPGLRGCGFAWWTERELIMCGYATGAAEGRGPAAWIAAAHAVQTTRPKGGDPLLERIVVETMRVYTGGASAPADLLELQGVAGALVGLVPARIVEGVEASAWKGQVPRDVMGRRVEAKLEKLGWTGRVVRPKRKTHHNDAMHAAGLGLFVLA